MWGESNYSHDLSLSPCLYCTRCTDSYWLWHLLSVKKKHLLSIFTLRSRLIVGGRERSRGRIWFTRQTLLPIQIKQLFFWNGLCHNFVFTASVFLPKSIFHSHVYRETTPVHCCEMSRHISHAWRGSSPPLGTRGAEFSLVSATVVETVDRSRDRQTYVPSKIQEGTAIISAVYRHPLLLFEEEFFRGLLRVPAETVTDNWNHVPLVHTRICTGHTHTFLHMLYT